MNINDTITRKEIAALIGVSIDTVIRKERQWGLRKHLNKSKQRPLIFFRGPIIKILTMRGIIAE